MVITTPLNQRRPIDNQGERANWASRYVADLVLECETRDLLCTEVKGQRLSLLRFMESALVIALSDDKVLRTSLVALSRVLSRPMRRWRPFWSSEDVPSQPRALFCVRAHNHVRDAVPVADRLSRMGIRTAFFCGLSEADSLGLSGQTVLRPNTHARSLLEGLRRRREVEGLRGLIERRDVWDRIYPVVSMQVVSVLAELDLAESAFDNFQPHVVWVGNPCTLDGRVSSHSAHARGIKVATAQHGLLRGDDPNWDSAPFDQMMLWGTQGYNVLRERGLDPSRLEVTGPIWADEIVKRAIPKFPRLKPSVLLALSGPGHSIGHEEHLALVQRIGRAMLSHPEISWRIRLHRKDRVEYYRPYLGSNVRLSGHPNIEQDLPQVDALLTVGSTAALDAMLANVPVITIDRPQGNEADFVLSGSTFRVGLADVLSDRLAVFFADGSPQHQLDAAKAYRTESVGDLDGGALDRVVSKLLDLMKRDVALAS